MAGLLTAAAGMIAAARYRHFICFFSASHILQCRIFTNITPYLIFSMQVYGAQHWCIWCILYS